MTPIPPKPDHTHDTNLTSWVLSAETETDFPIQNLPLGVFSLNELGPRIGTAIGDQIFDLSQLDLGMDQTIKSALKQPTLNALFALPSSQLKALRLILSKSLSDKAYAETLSPHLYAQNICQMHLPVHIGDYTDFYVGIHHATRVGKLFRPDNPLLPNYKHVPIGYHGRASSITVSDTPVVRPLGQTLPPEALEPIFGPTKRLDFELELGLIIGTANELGSPISIHEAPQHMAGLCLLNDWSARDLQAWEYQPLGPFLAKNFHSSLSPWVITMEALVPFRGEALKRAVGDPNPLPYLTDAYDQAFGGVTIKLEAHIKTKAMADQGDDPIRLCQSQATHAMYWTLSQILTHHTSGGCNLRTGDLLGTGTLSGPETSQSGSLLELSQGGKHPFDLGNGEFRRFLEDGDEISFTARAEAKGFKTIGFGECRGKIMPARSV
jgi:fumarylacetoacetase